MSFDIFSTSFYLANNPDVADAVATNPLLSGFQHFQRFGLAEGRTNISPFFDEALYLQTYSDVAAAVSAGVFRSGLQHFLLVGEGEGRGLLKEIYTEQVYLAVYPDVATAVSSGTLPSGYSHFRATGISEGRFDAAFNEQYYLLRYPDVASAVAQGTVSSGLQHFLNNGRAEERIGAVPFNEGTYMRRNLDVAIAVALGEFSSGLEHFVLFGDAEGRQGSAFDEAFYLNDEVNPQITADFNSSRLPSVVQFFLEIGQFFPADFASFTGTFGNDVVQSFGFTNNSIVGTQSVQQLGGGVASTRPGEQDILIGSPTGNDLYQLGFRPLSEDPNNLANQELRLYVGGGDSDFATIRGFEVGFDSIFLSGSSEDYMQNVVDGNLRISTASGDLLGIVEGVSFPLIFTPFDTNTTLLG